MAAVAVVTVVSVVAVATVVLGVRGPRDEQQRGDDDVRSSHRGAPQPDTQRLLTHVCPEPHWRPHAPQWLGLVRRSTQENPHAVRPVVHVVQPPAQ